MKVILLLISTLSFTYADDDFWRTVDKSDYDFKFAYYEDLEVDPSDESEPVKTMAEETELKEMKMRAKKVQEKIQENKTVLNNIKDPNDDEDLEVALFEEDVEQNIPLKNESFDVKKDSKREFTYDPIVQYKEKVVNTNLTDRKKNYFLPWEQRFKSLVPLGVMGSLNYNFGSISQNSNNLNFDTDKKARVGFNLNWTVEKELKNEMFFIFSTQLSFVTAPSLAQEIDLSSDWQIFERVYFPTLRFSYFTPFAELGFNKFSHLSPLITNVSVQAINNKGYFLGLGTSFRIPIRNTEISLNAGLRAHLFYSSESPTLGNSIDDVSGNEVFASMNWHFLKKLFIEGQVSRTSLSSKSGVGNFDLGISRYYAGFGLRI